MIVDLQSFSYAVSNKRTKHFYEVGVAPAWLLASLQLANPNSLETDRVVLLSSDTAEVKLRKHFPMGDLVLLLDTIRFALGENTVEVYRARYPNAVEAYFIMDGKLWLVVLKSTKAGEILVSTVHRTDIRNLQKMRHNEIVHGSKIIV
jgi:hypothetical protein